MCLLGNLSAVMVDSNRPGISHAAVRIGQIGGVISHGQDQLIGYEMFFHEIEHQLVGHLAGDQFSFDKFIRLLQNLTGTDAVALRFVCLDLRDGDRLPAPSVIDEQFSVDAEHPVKQIFIFDRHPGDIAHSVHPCGFQFAGISFADSPKVCKRSV